MFPRSMRTSPRPIWFVWYSFRVIRHLHMDATGVPRDLPLHQTIALRQVANPTTMVSHSR